MSNSSFSIALDQLEANSVDSRGVRAINICSQADAMLAVVKRVAALNPEAGEIGPGMLAQLVADARAIIAKATGE